MANWKQIITNGIAADLSIGGDITLTGATTDRKIGQGYTNAAGAQGGNLSINAGGANAGTDGNLKLCPDYGVKVVLHTLAEYTSNPTFNDSKQLISKGYVDDLTEALIENETVINSGAGDLPELDKLLIYRYDEGDQKSIPLDDFWKKYTDAEIGTLETMVVDSNGFLTAPSYFQIERTAELMYLYTVDAYYGWTDGGTRTTMSTITGTTDTGIAAWQANRCGHMVAQKSFLKEVVAYSTASGVSYDYEVDCWKISAMDTSEMTTIHPLTLTHLKNWSVSPSNNSRIEPLSYVPASNGIAFEEGERILFTLKRTGGTTGINGRYYYLSYTCRFQTNNV